ncbi:hypothetical protein VPH35_100124 [Triticum aestivum]
MEKEATHPSMKARGTSTDSGGPTALALRLSNKFSDCEEHEGQNIMFSPLSIYTALGLLAAGARGDALDEILAHALAAADPSGPLVVTSACSVWCQKDLPLKPAGRRRVVQGGRTRRGLREKGRRSTGRWVAKATKKLITSVLPPGSVHGGTKLVLTNAVYFKGMWENAFSKSYTNDHMFHRLDGSTVHVPFMEGRSHDEYLVATYDGFKVLKLPYKKAANNGARYSMCVFLPTARDGLRSLADEMASGGPGFLFDHLPTRPRELSFFCSMKKVLESLGLRAAFSEEADLSDMVEEDSSRNNVRLCVEDVFHRAVVEVNEEGTEAAASTAIDVFFCCDFEPVPVDFVANHPFAFFIVEEAATSLTLLKLNKIYQCKKDIWKTLRINRLIFYLRKPPPEPSDLTDASQRWAVRSSTLITILTWVHSGPLGSLCLCSF